MTFFSTFFFIVHYRKTQFQLSFFRHHSVEIVSKYVSKSTPLFSSAQSTIIKWEIRNFKITFTASSNVQVALSDISRLAW
jgi:hypothetical protein